MLYRRRCGEALLLDVAFRAQGTICAEAAAEGFGNRLQGAGQQYDDIPVFAMLPEFRQSGLDPGSIGYGLDELLCLVGNEAYGKPVKVGLVLAKNVTPEPGKPANDEPGGR